MKKIMLIILVLFCFILSSASDYWKKNDIELNISFDKYSYITNKTDLIITITLENNSNRSFFFESIAPEFRAIKLLFYDDLNNLIIKYDYHNTNRNEIGVGILMAPAIKCESNKSISVIYSVNTFYDIEEIYYNGIVTVYSIYPIEYQEGHFIKIKDWKESNKIRIFFNMEQDLIDSSIRVEPEKWNVNWEDSEGEGVFTVWIEKIEGYSVEDIKQDTILFNGTLPPEEIKILPNSGNEKEKIMQLKFKKKNGIQYLGELKPGEKKNINISGQLTDEKWFIGETEIEITGKD